MSQIAKRRRLLVTIAGLVLPPIAGVIVRFTELFKFRLDQQGTPTSAPSVVKVGLVSEVPLGGMKQFNVDLKSVLIVNLEGRLYGLAPYCTHQGTKLVNGTIKGKVLTCPLHAAKFDVTTGEVLGLPITIPPFQGTIDPLKTYKVYMEGDDILIEF